MRLWVSKGIKNLGENRLRGLCVQKQIHFAFTHILSHYNTTRSCSLVKVKRQLS